MKNRKNFNFILIVILLSLFFSFALEMFFNRNVIKNNNSYKPKIVDMKGIVKEGNWYKTNSKDSYIAFELNKNYVNKINFTYKYDKEFMWKLKYNDIIECNSSSELITQAVRKLNTNISKKNITLSFSDEGIKIKDISINNKIYINWIRILVVFMISFGTILLIKYRKYFINNLENAFLFIILITGTIMMLSIPKNVYISWDDQIHLKNSYTFLNSESSEYSSALKTVSVKDKIDDTKFTTQEEKIELYKYLNQLHNKTRKDKIQINNYSAKYNKLIYLPFYIGFKISNIFNFNYVGTILLSKLLNFLCYVLIMFCAIKISTYAKKIIFLIALLASNVFLSVQFSYDPVITASITLGLSIFLRILESEKLNKKYLLSFIICIIWASLPKAIYCPLLLLLIFIPNDKFDNKKQAIIFKSLVILIMLLLISTFVLPFLIGEVAGDVRGGNTNASGQLSLILHNPINYLKIIIRFFIANGQAMFIGEKTFVCLSYINQYINPFTSFIYIVNLILMLYILFSDSYDKNIITSKMKIILSIIYGGISVLIATSMYLSFTVLGSNDIAGVQPRYFIPILLILLLIIVPTKEMKGVRKKRNNNTNILILIIPYITLMLINFLLVYRGIGI